MNQPGPQRRPEQPSKPPSLFPAGETWAVCIHCAEFSLHSCRLGVPHLLTSKTQPQAQTWPWESPGPFLLCDCQATSCLSLALPPLILKARFLVAF